MGVSQGYFTTVFGILLQCVRPTYLLLAIFFSIHSVEIVAAAPPDYDPPPADLAPDLMVIWDALFNQELAGYGEVLPIMQFYSPLIFKPGADRQIPVARFLNHPEVQRRIMDGAAYGDGIMRAHLDQVVNYYRSMGIEIDMRTFLGQAWLDYLKKRTAYDKNSEKTKETAAARQYALQSMQQKYSGSLANDMARWTSQQRREYEKLVSSYRSPGVAQNNLTKGPTTQWLDEQVRLYFDQLLPLILDNLRDFLRFDQSFFRSMFYKKIEAVVINPGQSYEPEKTPYDLLSNYSDYESSVRIEYSPRSKSSSDQLTLMDEIRLRGIFPAGLKEIALEANSALYAFGFHIYHLFGEDAIPEYGRHGLTAFARSIILRDSHTVSVLLRNLTDARAWSENFPLFDSEGRINESAIRQLGKNKFAYYSPLLSSNSYDKYMDLEGILSASWDTQEERAAKVGFKSLSWWRIKEGRDFNGKGEQSLAKYLNIEFSEENEERIGQKAKPYIAPQEIKSDFSDTPTNTSIEEAKALGASKLFRVDGPMPKSNSLVFVVRARSDFHEKIPWAPNNSKSTTLTLTPVATLEISSEGMALPHAIHYDLQTLQVRDERGHALEIGKDFVVHKLKGREGLWLQPTISRRYRWWISMKFSPSQSEEVRVSSILIDQVRLNKEVDALKALGMLSLAKDLAGSKNLEKLGSNFQKSNTYTFQAEAQSRYTNPQNYAFYTKFLMDGKLYFQCNGANVLYSLILSRVLPALNAQVVSGYVAESGYMDAIPHAITQIESDHSITYQDVTPGESWFRRLFLNEPKSPGTPESPDQKQSEEEIRKHYAQKMTELLERIAPSFAGIQEIGNNPIFRVRNLFRLTRLYLGGEFDFAQYKNQIQKELWLDLSFLEKNEMDAFNFLHLWLSSELQSFQSYERKMVAQGKASQFNPDLAQAIATMANTILDIIEGIQIMILRSSFSYNSLRTEDLLNLLTQKNDSEVSKRALEVLIERAENASSDDERKRILEKISRLNQENSSQGEYWSWKIAQWRASIEGFFEGIQRQFSNASQSFLSFLENLRKALRIDSEQESEPIEGASPHGEHSLENRQLVNNNSSEDRSPKEQRNTTVGEILAAQDLAKLLKVMEERSADIEEFGSKEKSAMHAHWAKLWKQENWVKRKQAMIYIARALIKTGKQWYVLEGASQGLGFVSFYASLWVAAILDATFDADVGIEDYTELWSHAGHEAIKYFAFAAAAGSTSQSVLEARSLIGFKVWQTAGGALEQKVASHAMKVRVNPGVLRGVYAKQAGMLAGIIVTHLLFEDFDEKTFWPGVMRSLATFFGASVVVEGGIMVVKGLKAVVKGADAISTTATVVSGGTVGWSKALVKILQLGVEIYLAPYAGKSWDKARLHAEVAPKISLSLKLMEMAERGNSIPESMWTIPAWGGIAYAHPCKWVVENEKLRKEKEHLVSTKQASIEEVTKGREKDQLLLGQCLMLNLLSGVSEYMLGISLYEQTQKKAALVAKQKSDIEEKYLREAYDRNQVGLWGDMVYGGVVTSPGFSTGNYDYAMYEKEVDARHQENIGKTRRKYEREVLSHVSSDAISFGLKLQEEVERGQKDLQTCMGKYGLEEEKLMSCVEKTTKKARERVDEIWEKDGDYFETEKAKIALGRQFKVDVKPYLLPAESIEAGTLLDVVGMLGQEKRSRRNGRLDHISTMILQTYVNEVTEWIRITVSALIDDKWDVQMSQESYVAQDSFTDARAYPKKLLPAAVAGVGKEALPVFEYGDTNRYADEARDQKREYQPTFNMMSETLLELAPITVSLVRPDPLKRNSETWKEEWLKAYYRFILDKAYEMAVAKQKGEGFTYYTTNTPELGVDDLGYITYRERIIEGWYETQKDRCSLPGLEGPKDPATSPAWKSTQEVELKCFEGTAPSEDEEAAFYVQSYEQDAVLTWKSGKPHYRFNAAWVVTDNYMKSLIRSVEKRIQSGFVVK